MSVRQYGGFVLVCDRCRAQYDVDDPLEYTIKSARSCAYEVAGWLFWKSKDICVDCVVADNHLPHGNAARVLHEAAAV